MKSQFIFIVSLVLISCFSAYAQKHKSQYLLTEVYTDSNFLRMDTETQHTIKLFLLRKKKKQEIKALPHKVYEIENKKVEYLLLKIDERELRINIQKFKDKFGVLKIYINEDAKTNDVNLSIKKGDIIYQFKSCDDCHKIEIRQITVTANSNNKPTTGYKFLDDYILK